jgi:hypothetical protein
MERDALAGCEPHLGVGNPVAEREHGGTLLAAGLAGSASHRRGDGALSRTRHDNSSSVVYFDDVDLDAPS